MADKETRESVGSVALICRRADGKRYWLARWNKNWACYYFVGGHRRDGESYRDCLVREVEEELGLAEGRDYRLGTEPLKHVEYEAWSRSAKARTQYKLDLFPVKTRYNLRVYDVKLRESNEVAALNSWRDVRWLSEEEIQVQRTSDGAPVSETMSRLLESIGWHCAEPEEEDGESPGDA